MLIRILDILLSIIAIVLLSPVLLPIYLVLKLTGQHQAFYVQERVGRGGKSFGVFKFVTMVSNAEHMTGGYLTQKDDPRVLPLGKFLRKTKFNELPQLFNILFGQMSFVGPRPQAKPHYDLYSPEVKRAIDAVTPGLTGIGSVVFRDEEDILSELVVDRNHFHDTIIAPYKGLLELWYCKHRTLKIYFLLLLLTGWTLVRPRTIVWLQLFPDVPPVPSELRAALGVDKYDFKMEVGSLEKTAS